MRSKRLVAAGQLRIPRIPNRYPIPIHFRVAERDENRLEENSEHEHRMSKADAISDCLNGRQRRVLGPRLWRLRQPVQDALGIR